MIGPAEEVAAFIADLLDEITVNANPDFAAVKQLKVRSMFDFHFDIQNRRNYSEHLVAFCLLTIIFLYRET